MIIVFTDDECFRFICLDSFFRKNTRGINSRKNKEVKTGKTIHAEKKCSARAIGIIDMIREYVTAATSNGKKFF